MTNQTGRTYDDRSTIDVRLHAPGVKLVRIFTPSTASAAMPTDRLQAVSRDEDRQDFFEVLTSTGMMTGSTSVLPQ